MGAQKQILSISTWHQPGETCALQSGEELSPGGRDILFALPDKWLSPFALKIHYKKSIQYNCHCIKIKKNNKAVLSNNLLTPKFSFLDTVILANKVSWMEKQFFQILKRDRPCDNSVSWHLLVISVSASVTKVYHFCLYKQLALEPERVKMTQEPTVPH